MHERAILIGLVTPDLTQDIVHDYLLELDFLARTAGAETIKKFTQKMPFPDKATFLGHSFHKETLPNPSCKKTIGVNLKFSLVILLTSILLSFKLK